MSTKPTVNTTDHSLNTNLDPSGFVLIFRNPEDFKITERKKMKPGHLGPESSFTQREEIRFKRKNKPFP